MCNRKMGCAWFTSVADRIDDVLLSIISGNIVSKRNERTDNENSLFNKYLCNVCIFAFQIDLFSGANLRMSAGLRELAHRNFR